MSPRRRRLRNRKRIKAPKRFENEEYGTSPRQVSAEESKESSDSEEEFYESPKPKKPKPRRPAYRGKVIEFNPNLPPAAFPTLDHPDYVHNGGNIPVDLGLQSQELAGFESISSSSLGPERHSDSAEDLPASTSTPAEFNHLMSPSVMQRSNTERSKARGSMLSSMYGESTDNGPRSPIWASNMAHMEEAGKMSDLDRIMLEMETSDEEDAAARPTKLAKTASIKEFPAWDDLTIAHKLDLADTIGELYPDLTQVTHKLRLNPSQKEELVELLTQRQDRSAREEANQQRLMEQTKEVLLQGKSLSQSEFHQMVEENLYGEIKENDHLQTNVMELKRARAYLEYCGFDPALADSSWEVPSVSNAPSGTGSRPARNKPEASLLNATAQTLPSPFEKPSSRRSAPYTPSEKSPYLPDPHSEPVQQHPQGFTSQQYPTPAHALIAQHSPAAPLSKVPAQSYRVAAATQSGDLRARYQGAMRAQQHSSSQIQSDTSAYTDRQAINKKVSTASGATSSPTNPQEGNSSPVGLHALAPKGVPIAPTKQKRQRVADTDAGASAPQGNGAMVANRETVNKKKRKKSVARTDLES